MTFDVGGGSVRGTVGRVSAVEHRRPAGRSPMPPDERYLSRAAVDDAAGALRGLAETLLRVRGTFADDAVVEADRLRVLADGLAEWSPHRSTDRGDASGRGAARRGEQRWAGLLGVYFRPALEPVRAAARR